MEMKYFCVWVFSNNKFFLKVFMIKKDVKDEIAVVYHSSNDLLSTTIFFIFVFFSRIYIKLLGCAVKWILQIWKQNGRYGLMMILAKKKISKNTTSKSFKHYENLQHTTYHTQHDLCYCPISGSKLIDASWAKSLIVLMPSYLLPPQTQLTYLQWSTHHQIIVYSTVWT